jgi:hypothetical protein
VHARVFEGAHEPHHKRNRDAALNAGEGLRNCQRGAYMSWVTDVRVWGLRVSCAKKWGKSRSGLRTRSSLTGKSSRVILHEGQVCCEKCQSILPLGEQEWCLCQRSAWVGGSCVKWEVCNRLCSGMPRCGRL